MQLNVNSIFLTLIEKKISQVIFIFYCFKHLSIGGKQKLSSVILEVAAFGSLEKLLFWSSSFWHVISCKRVRSLAELGDLAIHHLSVVINERLNLWKI